MLGQKLRWRQPGQPPVRFHRAGLQATNHGFEAGTGARTRQPFQGTGAEPHDSADQVVIAVPIFEQLGKAFIHLDFAAVACDVEEPPCEVGERPAQAGEAAEKLRCREKLRRQLQAVA